MYLIQLTCCSHPNRHLLCPNPEIAVSPSIYFWFKLSNIRYWWQLQASNFFFLVFYSYYISMSYIKCVCANSMHHARRLFPIGLPGQRKKVIFMMPYICLYKCTCYWKNDPKNADVITTQLSTKHIASLEFLASIPLQVILRCSDQSMNSFTHWYLYPCLTTMPVKCLNDALYLRATTHSLTKPPPLFIPQEPGLYCCPPTSHRNKLGFVEQMSISSIFFLCILFFYKAEEFIVNEAHQALLASQLRWYRMICLWWLL